MRDHCLNENNLRWPKWND